jgi:2-polyprenyl-6-methoxyphenol hydroxylase-like FAD-dependent oxidoreductase
MTLNIHNVTKKYPHLADLVGLGSFAALANHHGIISHREPQDSARLYVILTTGDENFADTTGLAIQLATVVRSCVLEDAALLGSWGPVLKELVTVACDEEVAGNPSEAMDIRPLHMLSVGHTWERKVSATVIGDAAHLMCSWAGERVNLAMWDSLLLAQAIIKAHKMIGQDTVAFQSALHPLIKQFEVDMVLRAKMKAEMSFRNGQMMFGEGGSRALSGFFLSFGPLPG